MSLTEKIQMKIAPLIHKFKSVAENHKQNMIFPQAGQICVSEVKPC